MKQLIKMICALHVCTCSLSGNDYIPPSLARGKQPCISYETSSTEHHAIPSDSSDNMNAAEDFLLLLLHAHGVAAEIVIQSANPTLYEHCF